MSGNVIGVNSAIISLTVGERPEQVDGRQ